MKSHIINSYPDWLCWLHHGKHTTPELTILHHLCLVWLRKHYSLTKYRDQNTEWFYVLKKHTHNITQCVKEKPSFKMTDVRTEDVSLPQEESLTRKDVIISHSTEYAHLHRICHCEFEWGRSSINISASIFHGLLFTLYSLALFNLSTAEMVEKGAPSTHHLCQGWSTGSSRGMIVFLSGGLGGRETYLQILSRL